MLGADKAASGARNIDEMVPYEGSKSNDPTYNFCYLCKDRLDTVHDEQDEGWYFVNTKKVRFRHEGQTKVVNVHASCFKESESSLQADKKSNSNL